MSSTLQCKVSLEEITFADSPECRVGTDHPGMQRPHALAKAREGGAAVFLWFIRSRYAEGWAPAGPHCTESRSSTRR